MPKFRGPRSSRRGPSGRRMRSHPTATENAAGGLAFDVSAKLRLYKKVCTSLVGEQKFYQRGEKHDLGILKDIQTVAKEDPEWVLKLAAYARNEMYLRSIGVMVLCEASRIEECRPFVRKWTPFILRRADEPKEALAYMLNHYGRPVPKCLRKGMAEAMRWFDEYQLEKYDQARKGQDDVTFMDVLRLVRPRPRNRSQEAAFGYLCEKVQDADLIPKIAAKREFDQLTEWGPKAQKLMAEGHLTWEVAISKFGNRKAVWDGLKLPFMAGLRNLRNMIKAGADIEPVLKMLKDPEAVRRSKQLPFRFYTAHQMLQHGDDPFAYKKVSRALEAALEASVDNIPELPGKTLVMVDVSQSMTQPVSGRSQATCMDIAALFGVACARKMDAIVASFSSDYRFLDVSGTRIFEAMEQVKYATSPYATYTHLPIQHLNRHQIRVDRIIVLSDEQCYASGGRWYDPQFPTELAHYKARINRDVKVVAVDLQGYGTGALPEDEPNTAFLAGWSERVFSFLKEFDQGLQNADELIGGYVAPEPRSPWWTSLEPPLRAATSRLRRRGGPFSFQDVAELCGVTVPTVRRWARKGELTALKRNGDVTVSKTALQRLAKQKPRYADRVAAAI